MELSTRIRTTAHHRYRQQQCSACPQAIADELAAYGTLIQWQAVKAHHGELLIKSAWQLLPQSERDCLTAIFDIFPL